MLLIFSSKLLELQNAKQKKEKTATVLSQSLMSFLTNATDSYTYFFFLGFVLSSITRLM